MAAASPIGTVRLSLRDLGQTKRQINSDGVFRVEQKRKEIVRGPRDRYSPCWETNEGEQASRGGRSAVRGLTCLLSSARLSGPSRGTQLASIFHLVRVEGLLSLFCFIFFVFSPLFTRFNLFSATLKLFRYVSFLYSIASIFFHYSVSFLFSQFSTQFFFVFINFFVILIIFPLFFFFT